MSSFSRAIYLRLLQVKNKVIIVPAYGMNQFYKLWVDAETKKNDYIPMEVHWSSTGRDESGKKKL